MKTTKTHRWIIALLVPAAALWACDADDDASPADDEDRARPDKAGMGEDDAGRAAAADIAPDDASRLEALIEKHADKDRPAWLKRAWQLGHPEVAAGLASTFHFFEDGLFVFSRGTTDECAEGVLSRIGVWHAAGDDELVLYEERRLEERGGTLVEDDIGCHREGSERVVSIHDEPMKERLSLTECTAEEKDEYPSYHEDLGAECYHVGDELRWTTAAETDGWRDDWPAWFAEAEVVAE